MDPIVVASYSLRPDSRRRCGLDTKYKHDMVLSTTFTHLIHRLFSDFHDKLRLLAEVNVLSSDDGPLRWESMFHGLVPVSLYCIKVLKLHICELSWIANT